MGIKSTKYLTREDAIERIEELRRKLFGANNYSWASDIELEDLLEDLNDQYYRREYGGDSGFDNYIITTAEEKKRIDDEWDQAFSKK